MWVKKRIIIIFVSTYCPWHMPELHCLRSNHKKKYNVKSHSMKKLLMMVVMAVMSMSVFAQNPAGKHEISLYAGIGGATETIGIATAIVGGDIDCSGSFGVNYFYNINNRWSVGAAVSIESLTIKYKKIDGSKVRSNFISVLPAVKFHYVNKEHFGLYSKAAAGLTLQLDNADEFQTEDSVNFGFQASLLGVEAGGEHVKAFVEVGYGYEGLALAGVRFTF